ncbi:MAG: hypothetical protein ACYTFU_10090 [Planctomycetota bacterium]|jgi:hypothetical protein
MVPCFWTKFPDQNRAALNTIFSDLVSVPPAIQNLGPQASGPASASLAWPGRSGSPTPPSRPGRLAAAAGWPAAQQAGQLAAAWYLDG